MEPVYMNELMNTVVLEIAVKHVIGFVFGALIGTGIVCLIHKIKGD